MGRINSLSRQGPALIFSCKNLLLLPVSAEERVCLIQSLKISEPQVLVLQTFLFFLGITYIPRRTKDACVQVAAKKEVWLHRNGAGDHFEQRSRNKW